MVSRPLSGSYGFGDTATLNAPAIDGKNFSHWTADGSVISYANPLKLTVNAHTTLYAVYAENTPETKAAAGFTSITRTNDGESISFQAISSGETAGIIYITTATGNNLKIDGTGVTQVAAEKLTDSTTAMPASILDNNNCWMLQITPESTDTLYHARTYVTVSGTTTYGDVKDVKLSDLSSCISLIANLEGFEPGTNDLLEEMAKKRAENPSTVTKAPTAKNPTYSGQAQALVTAGEASGGTMQYALGTETEATQPYTTSIPTATEVGTYYVWYKAVGDSNHSDSTPASVRVTIQRRTTSVRVTFKVSNGSWDDGTTADKTVTLSGYEGDTLRLSASQIASAGAKPDDTYKAGSWNVTPSAGASITGNTTYTYTYAQKDSISHTVTFKVSQ